MRLWSVFESKTYFLQEQRHSLEQAGEDDAITRGLDSQHLISPSPDDFSSRGIFHRPGHRVKYQI